MIVVPSGEVDPATAPQVQRAIEELLERGFEQVVVDLRRVERLTSEGIRALSTASDRARALGATLSVVGGNPATRQVLKTGGVL